MHNATPVCYSDTFRGTPVNHFVDYKLLQKFGFSQTNATGRVEDARSPPSVCLRRSLLPETFI